MKIIRADQARKLNQLTQMNSERAIEKAILFLASTTIARNAMHRMTTAVLSIACPTPHHYACCRATADALRLEGYRVKIIMHHDGTDIAVCWSADLLD